MKEMAIAVRGKAAGEAKKRLKYRRAAVKYLAYRLAAAAIGGEEAGDEAAMRRLAWRIR